MEMSSQIEELWQGYNDQGEQTIAITKKEARLGALHGASHVWIWRRSEGSIEVLLQRRAGDKATWANHLDISAAGHIDSGETPTYAARRETHEEIGLAIEEARLTLIGVHRANLQAVISDQKIIENEFQFVYLLELQDDDGPIQLLDGEVGAIYWYGIQELQSLIDGESDDTIVPHGHNYFSMLIDALTHTSAQ